MSQEGRGTRQRFREEKGERGEKGKREKGEWEEEEEKEESNSTNEMRGMKGTQKHIRRRGRRGGGGEEEGGRESARAVQRYLEEGIASAQSPPWWPARAVLSERKASTAMAVRKQLLGCDSLGCGITIMW